MQSSPVCSVNSATLLFAIVHSLPTTFSNQAGFSKKKKVKPGT